MKNKQIKLFLQASRLESPVHLNAGIYTKAYNDSLSIMKYVVLLKKAIFLALQDWFLKKGRNETEILQ